MYIKIFMCDNMSTMNCENIDRTKVAATLGVVVAVAVLPLLVAASYKRVGCVPTCPSGGKTSGTTALRFALLVDRPWTALSPRKEQQESAYNAEEKYHTKNCAPDASSSPLVEGMSIPPPIISRSSNSSHHLDHEKQQQRQQQPPQ